MAKASVQMIVHHTGSLHIGIAYCSAYKFKSAFVQIFAHGIAFGGVDRYVLVFADVIFFGGTAYK
jgi:hypothetical protein